MREERQGLAGASHVGSPARRLSWRTSGFDMPTSTSGLRTECSTAATRPGRAAAAEHGVRSPLVEVGMSKQEVRALSRRAGLPTWDAPASPCLSSRIAYGTTVTIKRLREVETGEEIMRSLGFREFRVRHHDELVRLEIAPAELENALRREVTDELARRFRALGFRYVTLDLHGYRTGAMNEILKERKS